MSKFLLSLSAVVICLSTNASAMPSDYWPSTIEVFAPAGQMMSVSQGRKGDASVFLYEIDRVQQIESRMTNLVPAAVAQSLDEKQVAQYMAEHFQAEMKEAAGEAVEAYTGIVRAGMYGLTDVPAIVFDRQFIVYGERLSEAVKHYQQFMNINDR